MPAIGRHAAGGLPDRDGRAVLLWLSFQAVRIAVTMKVSDMFEREGRLGNMLFIIRETNYVNQYGKTIAVQRGTGISYQPSE